MLHKEINRSALQRYLESENLTLLHLFKEQRSEKKSRKWGLATIAVLSMVLVGATYTLPATFYPPEAEKRGLSPIQYGLVFSLYEVAAILTSIASPFVVGKLSPKVLLALSLVVDGIFCFAMGLLQYVHLQLTFYALSLLFRFMTGATQVLVNISLIAIITSEFYDSVGFYVSLLEAGVGLGGIIGPLFGGILYDSFGFLFPFAAAGVLLIFLTLSTLKSVPYVYPSETYNVCDVVCIIKSAFKSCSVWLDMISIIFSTSVMSMLAATLEPHVRTLGLSSTYTGVLFLLEGVAYMIFSPIFGHLCDKGWSMSNCNIFGCLCLAVGMGMVGPIPWVPMEPNLYLIIPATIILGIGVSGTIVPSFLSLKLSCCPEGCVEDEQVTNVTSSLFSLALSTGGAIGPVIGGYISENYGFRYSTLYGIGLALILIVVVCITRINK